MHAEDLDGTVSCLMDAADSLVELDDDLLPEELQTGMVSLATRINSLVTYAEALQRRVAQLKVRRVRAIAAAAIEKPEAGEPFEVLMVGESALPVTLN